MCLGRGPPGTLPNFSPSAGQLMLEETLQSCTNKVGNSWRGRWLRRGF